MSQEKMIVEKRGAVLLIGFNRPEKRNAFDVDMYFILADAFGRLQADPDLRCGMVYSVGPHSTSGLDLAKWAAIFAKGESPQLPDGSIEPFGWNEDRRLAKPMVMAAQGICYTVGLELMLACDIRIVASDARFAQIEIKRGIFPVGGATVRLMNEIGWGNAMRYLLTGDEITAPEALRMGLVQEVVEPGRQFDRALELAERVSEAGAAGRAGVPGIGSNRAYRRGPGCHGAAYQRPSADHEKRGRRRGTKGLPGAAGGRIQGPLGPVRREKIPACTEPDGTFFPGRGSYRLNGCSRHSDKGGTMRRIVLCAIVAAAALLIAQPSVYAKKGGQGRGTERLPARSA